jgi:hypothetical protein
MKTSRTEQSRAARMTEMHVGAVLVLVLAIVAAFWWTRSGLATSRGTTSPDAAKATLEIEVFKTTDSQSVVFGLRAFTDSVAARLADVKGLSIKVVGDRRPTAEFTLTGDVRVSAGRVVLSTRLLHSGDRLPVWSGTFWRSPNSLHNFVDDVAAGVAQALYADLARRALTTTKEKS